MSDSQAIDRTNQIIVNTFPEFNNADSILDRADGNHERELPRFQNPCSSACEVCKFEVNNERIKKVMKSDEEMKNMMISAEGKIIIQKY